ncbi:MAG TPA: hypothetical protein PLU30_00085 [Verrucomicrobiae bacterium]|nr:hypothetical protein [Verrucomicrobiae bacterium]
MGSVCYQFRSQMKAVLLMLAFSVVAAGVRCHADRCHGDDGHDGKAAQASQHAAHHCCDCVGCQASAAVEISGDIAAAPRLTALRYIAAISPMNPLPAHSDGPFHPPRA